MADIFLTRRDGDRTWTIPTGAQHTFTLQRLQSMVLELDDLHFHHDSAVLLPDHGEERDPDRITALVVLATAYEHAADNPSQQLLIAAHTDTSGAAAYNVPLSVQRADSTLHLLEGNRQGWVDVAHAKHKVEDYQQILKWASWTFGWACDPGAIDDVHGSRTTAALKEFQRAYNDYRGERIAVDGAIGPQTWGACFDLYVEVIAILLGTTEADLPTNRSRLRFLGAKRVGCGENFPIEEPRRNDYRSTTNRRVELLFFESGQEPALECHTGTACDSARCQIYDPAVYRHKHIPPRPIPTTAPAGGWGQLGAAARPILGAPLTFPACPAFHDGPPGPGCVMGRGMNCAFVSTPLLAAILNRRLGRGRRCGTEPPRDAE